MTALPVLYSFRRCPYAIRARLALKYAGVPVALREVALRRKPLELLALSPKGTVPVLQLPGQAPLDESLDIMAWALARSDPEGWQAGDAEATRSLIATNDGPFKQWLDGYKYPGRHALPPTACRDLAVEHHLAPLARRLSGQAFLQGDRPGLPDMALLPFVRQFAQVDADWFDQAPLPALRRWLMRGVSSDLFRAAMHDKLPPWQPGDPETVF